jgi:hypothetical protein
MRHESIKSKLNHVNDNIQRLGNLLFDSKMQNQRLDNITHLVGDSLSNTTECFDYCAKDIFEKYILPKNLHMKDWNIYFPFSINALNKAPFSIMEKENPLLYKYLVDLAKNAESENLLDNTLIKASLPKKIRQIVNDKKHNDILEINSKGGAELVSEFGGVKIIFPLRQIGITETEIDHDSMQGPMIISNAYELKETGDEVMALCQFSYTATNKIIEEIYSKFLN